MYFLHRWLHLQIRFHFLFSNLNTFYFSSLFQLELPVQCLVRSTKSEHPRLVHSLRGKAFSFSPLSVMLAVGFFFIDTLSQVEEVLFYGWFYLLSSSVSLGGNWDFFYFEAFGGIYQGSFCYWVTLKFHSGQNHTWYDLNPFEFKILFWSRLWAYLGKCSVVHLRSVWNSVVGVFYKYQVRLVNVLCKFTISSLIFCTFVLSVTEKGVVKSLTIVRLSLHLDYSIKLILVKIYIVCKNEKEISDHNCVFVHVSLQFS